MEVIFSSNLTEQLPFQIKRAREIRELFETTLVIEVRGDDGSIIRLELCMVQNILCPDCVTGKSIVSFITHLASVRKSEFGLEFRVSLHNFLRTRFGNS